MLNIRVANGTEKGSELFLDGALLKPRHRRHRPGEDQPPLREVLAVAAKRWKQLLGTDKFHELDFVEPDSVELELWSSSCGAMPLRCLARLRP